jgi:hypothetical protein
LLSAPVLVSRRVDNNNNIIIIINRERTRKKLPTRKTVEMPAAIDTRIQRAMLLGIGERIFSMVREERERERESSHNGSNGSVTDTGMYMKRA